MFNCTLTPSKQVVESVLSMRATLGSKTLRYCKAHLGPSQGSLKQSDWLHCCSNGLSGRHPALCYAIFNFFLSLGILCIHISCSLYTFHVCKIPWPRMYIPNVRAKKLCNKTHFIMCIYVDITLLCIYCLKNCVLIFLTNFKREVLGMYISH